MFILRDLLLPLQAVFSNTAQGQKRKAWFVYTLLAVVVPFTSSITSNLLRALQTLFGLKLKSQRFYAFMASPTLPWKKLWHAMWGMIPSPAEEERLMLALDDSMNPKSGKKIFGCAHFYDHAAKVNQSSYPWSQCILVVGLLKKIKSRWACLPLDFRFYMMKKDIDAESATATRRGQVLPFEDKMAQAATMITDIQNYFKQPVLIVTDSWFGNNGLWSRLDRETDGAFHLLSRMRTNITLYDVAPVCAGTPKAGRPRKYGQRLGSVDTCAAKLKEKARNYRVFLYGKKKEVQAYSQTVMLKTMKCRVRVVWVYRKTRYVALMTTDMELSVEQIIEYYGARWKIESGFKEIKQDIGSSKSQVRNSESVLNHLNFCMMATTLTWIYADRLENAPDRRHKIRGRAGFAFSDVRRIIAEAALSSDFYSVCPVPGQNPQKSLVRTLLHMVA
ncbi:transposase [uncultured Desulfobacter sp.]|uniref:IS701 family transposase n=1 Tax=uncultured Desulfobacter sp. TaxID=240139 RepID=UPI002AAB54A7|nr:transposase [uncultured Desulfobacter sp.]